MTKTMAILTSRNKGLLSTLAPPWNGHPRAYNASPSHDRQIFVASGTKPLSLSLFSSLANIPSKRAYTRTERERERERENRNRRPPPNRKIPRVTSAQPHAILDHPKLHAPFNKLPARHRLCHCRRGGGRQQKGNERRRFRLFDWEYCEAGRKRVRRARRNSGSTRCSVYVMRRMAVRWKIDIYCVWVNARVARVIRSSIRIVCLVRAWRRVRDRRWFVWPVWLYFEKI